MVTLAVLVVGSTLAAGGADPPAVQPLPAAPIFPPREQRAERHRRRMASVHTVEGVALESGASLLHLLTAWSFIGHDLSCTGDDCKTGTPVALLLPAAAIAMG